MDARDTNDRSDGATWRRIDANNFKVSMLLKQIKYRLFGWGPLIPSGELARLNPNIVRRAK